MWEEVIFVVVCLFVISFFQNTHTYKPETNHFSREYSVPAIVQNIFFFFYMLYFERVAIW
jgi:hypothetical protein